MSSPYFARLMYDQTFGFRSSEGCFIVVEEGGCQPVVGHSDRAEFSDFQRSLVTFLASMWEDFRSVIPLG